MYGPLEFYNKVPLYVAAGTEDIQWCCVAW